MLPNSVVITTTSERPGIEERNRLSAQVAEALLWGADRGDRFQSVARFRGESSPKAGALSADEGVERVKLLEGWSSRRFTAPGWPGGDAYVYLIDGRARAVSVWLIAVVVLAGWVTCRRVFEKLPRRHLGLVVVMIACLLLGWFLPSRYAGYAWGLFGGGLLVLVVELGRGAG